MFWDRVAGVYDLFVNVVNRRTHQALRKIVAGLIQPGDRALECACGTGLLTEVIAPRCAHVTATDFAPKMLARARKNCAALTNITFEPADITALRYPDASFDAVVAGNVIHLLDEPMKALHELDRVCRPGGRLIIPTYMNRDKKGNTSGFATAVGKELPAVLSGGGVRRRGNTAGRGPHSLCRGGDEGQGGVKDALTQQKGLDK